MTWAANTPLTGLAQGVNERLQAGACPGASTQEALGVAAISALCQERLSEFIAED